MSKGIDEAPSKALIGELAAASRRLPAAAFSLRQSMATFGALVGAASAAAAYKLRQAKLRGHLCAGRTARHPGPWSWCPPPSAAWWWDRRATPRPRADATAAASAGDGPRLGLVGKARALLGAFQPAYWQALAVVGILYFARFDASFVTLRAKTVHGPRLAAPALTSIMMVTQAAWPRPPACAPSAPSPRATPWLCWASLLSSGPTRPSRSSPSTPGMMLGALLLGVHMAMTHGVTIGMLSTYIPSATIPGLGKVAGTAWSFTDMLLGGCGMEGRLRGGGHGRCC